MPKTYTIKNYSLKLFIKTYRLLLISNSVGVGARFGNFQ